MGLLDSLINAVTQSANAPAGGNQQPSTPVGGLNLGALLAAVGGLQGLLQILQQSGLGNVAQSWVSKGENLPVSGNQLSSALGPDLLAALAPALGL
ncbi:MAG TPA: YidB family protein, partial [Burkholderiaceae bacterium]